MNENYYRSWTDFWGVYKRDVEVSNFLSGTICCESLEGTSGFPLGSLLAHRAGLTFMSLHPFCLFTSAWFCCRVGIILTWNCKNLLHELSPLCFAQDHMRLPQRCQGAAACNSSVVTISSISCSGSWQGTRDCICPSLASLALGSGLVELKTPPISKSRLPWVSPRFHFLPPSFLPSFLSSSLTLSLNFNLLA